MFVLFLRVNIISDSFSLFMISLGPSYSVFNCLGEGWLPDKSLTPGIVGLVFVLRETADNQFAAHKHDKCMDWSGLSLVHQVYDQDRRSAC